MKSKLCVITFLVAAVLIIPGACKTTKNSKNYVKANQFWASHAIPVQTFTGNAVTGFTVTGARGTRITFPPNAFTDGKNVVNGNVSVTLKEILSKKDVILSGIMIESNAQLLESAGEFEIKATKNGSDLFVNPALGLNSGIIVTVPQVMNNQPMALFVQGKRESSDNIAGLNRNTWIPAPNIPFSNGFREGPRVYSFLLPGFQWVNCDRFYEAPGEKTTITASPVSQDNNGLTDLQVMLVFRDIASVVALPFNSSLGKFESYINSLPVGMQAQILAIGKDNNGYLQFGALPITISNNMHIDVPVRRSTQAEIETFLASVN